MKNMQNGIWTINLSRDDPACINLCSVHYNLQVFESVNLSFDKKKYIAVFDCSTEKTCTNTCNENM